MRFPRWLALVLVVVLLLLLAVAGSVLLAGRQRAARQAERAVAEHAASLRRLGEVDPALVRWRQVAALAVPLARPTCLTPLPDGRLVVGGDRALVVLEAHGAAAQTLPVPGSVLAVATAGGRYYVAAVEGVFTLGADGALAARWPLPDRRSFLSGIAVGAREVYLADAGKRLVWRLDRAGQVLGQFGARRPDQPDYGLLAPSFHLKVVLRPDGTLLVNNLGRLRVDHYDSRGALLGTIGRAGMAIEGFSGCCNPVALAALPGGGVATAEKGLRRVKVYSAAGAFSEVVATPQGLSRGEGDLALAVTARGALAVLDCGARVVRLFERTG